MNYFIHFSIIDKTRIALFISDISDTGFIYHSPNVLYLDGHPYTTASYLKSFVALIWIRYSVFGKMVLLCFSLWMTTSPMLMSGREFTSSSCSISDPTAWYITVNHCSNPLLNPAVQFIVILTADISNSRGADGRDVGPIRKLIFLDLYQL